MPFKLVSYLENDKVFINAVPNNWEQNGILFWPPTGDNEARLRNDENSLPDLQSWSSRPCKVKLLDIDSLKHGITLERKYTSLTDSESEERYLKSKCLQQKEMIEQDFNSLIFSDVQSSIAVHGEGTSSSLKEGKTISLAPSDVIVVDGTSEQEHALEANPTLYSWQLSAETTPGPSLVLGNENAILKRVAEMHDKLSNKLDELTKKCNQVIVDNAAINIKLDKVLDLVSNMPTKDDEIEKEKAVKWVQSINLPLKSHEELLAFEENLSKKEFKSQMVSILSEIGGGRGDRSGNALAFKISEKLFDVELLTNYNWTGTGKHKQKNAEKFAFMKFSNIINLFYDVLVQADKTYSRIQNEEFFKNKCLKHSKLRLQRKRKATASGVEPDEDDAVDNQTPEGNNDNAVAVPDLHVD